MAYMHSWSARRAHPDYATAWPVLLDEARYIIDILGRIGVVIAGPDGHAPRILDDTRGILLNGDARTHLAHEGFHLEPPAPGPGFTWAACKTARHPYDLAVTALLLRGMLLMPDAFLVHSDGDWEMEWAPARHLVGELFGPAPSTDPLSPEPLPHGED